MAENNPRRSRGETRARSARKGRPEARSGFVSTTAAVSGILAFGAFLWSRRDQISEQAGRVADRFSRPREGVQLDDYASSGTRAGDSRTQAEIAAEALTLKELGKRPLMSALHPF